MCGDVGPYPDCNGIIDTGDVIRLLNHVGNEDAYPFCSSEWCGDVAHYQDCNGEINTGDVVRLLNHVGDEDAYPLCCEEVPSATVAFAVPVVPAAVQNEVYLVPQDSSALFGETTDVEIWVNATNFQGGQIKLTYGSTCADVTNWVANTADFPLGTWNSGTPGEEWITFTALASKTGDYLIGTLTIHCVSGEECTAALDFVEDGPKTSKLFDNQGGEIPATWGDGTFECTVTTPTPTSTPTGTSTITPTPTPSRPWTFMVYLNGDNDLDEETFDVFNRLESAADDPNLDIIVLWDRLGPGNTKRYKVKYDTNLFELASYTQGEDCWDMGELNMGNGRTLYDFVTWTRKYYTARHYFLSLVDHGGGWAPTLPPALGRHYSSTGGSAMSWDATSSYDSLSTSELGNVFKFLTSDGVNKIDVVFYDACLMGMVENAYEIRDYADYFVASENMAWASWPYDRYVSSMTSATEPLTLAANIVN